VRKSCDDRREHAGAVLHKALETAVHAIERARGLADVLGSALRHRRDRLAAPEPLRRSREVRHRARHAPDHQHDDHADRHRHHARADQRRRRGGGRNPRKARLDVQPASVGQLHRGDQAHVAPRVVAPALPLGGRGRAQGRAVLSPLRAAFVGAPRPLEPAPHLGRLVAQLDQHLPGTAADQIGEALLQGIVAVSLDGVVHGVVVIDREPQARRARGAENLRMQCRRRRLHQADDRCRARQDLSAFGGAQREAALIEQNDQADRLRDDQGGQQQSDQLSGQAPRPERPQEPPQPSHVRSTSAAKL
jgi:hypothetical protein